MLILLRITLVLFGSFHGLLWAVIKKRFRKLNIVKMPVNQIETKKYSKKKEKFLTV